MIKKIAIVSIFVMCIFFTFTLAEAHSISFVNNTGSASKIENGKVAGSINEADAGDIVRISLYYMPYGKALSHWNLNGVPMNSGDNSLYGFDFVMPDEDVTFEAVLADEISSVEISGTFNEPQVGEQIPSINLQIVKVNGGTALIDKVAIDYSKFQKVVNSVANASNGDYSITGEHGLVYDDSDTEFENAELYHATCNIKIVDDDYAFARDLYMTGSGTYQYMDSWYDNHIYGISSRERLKYYGYEYSMNPEGYNTVFFYLTDGEWDTSLFDYDYSKNYVAAQGDSYGIGVPNIILDGYVLDYWTYSEDNWSEWNEEVCYPDGGRSRYSYYGYTRLYPVFRKAIEVPIFDDPYDESNLYYTEITYSGSDFVPSYSGYDSDVMTITGDSSAGPFDAQEENYNIYFEPKDGYVWASIPNSEYEYSTNEERHQAIPLSWKVNKQYVYAPSLEESSFTYTGETITPTIYFGEGSEDDWWVYGEDYIDIDGDTSAQNAGTYDIYLSLKDDTNYEFYDVSDSTIVLEWTIDPLYISFPYMETTEYYYTGYEIEPEIYYEDEYCYLDFDTYGFDVGEYCMTAYLNDQTNYIWDDCSNEPVDYVWYILKATPTLILNNLVHYEDEVEAADWELTPDITDGVVVIEYFVDGDYTTECPTEPGEYEVRATLTGDSNLEDAETVDTFVINRRLVNGDLDFNGIIDIIDVKLLLQKYINTTESTVLSDDDLFLMDMDGNEIIDIIDVRILLQRYINL